MYGVKESEVRLDEGKRAGGEGKSSAPGGGAASLGAAHVGRVALSEDQKLLHRAVGFVYSKIIQPEEEGGWSGWFERNCGEFDVAARDGSQVGRTNKLVYSELHREYEGMVERALAEFVEEEGIDDAQDLYMRIYGAQEEMADTVNLLLAAADYKKFVSLMKRRRKKQLKSGAAAAAAAAVAAVAAAPAAVAVAAKNKGPERAEAVAMAQTASRDRGGASVRPLRK
jgi:hypothetical protein